MTEQERDQAIADLWKRQNDLEGRLKAVEQELAQLPQKVENMIRAALQQPNDWGK